MFVGEFPAFLQNFEVLIWIVAKAQTKLKVRSGTPVFFSSSSLSASPQNPHFQAKSFCGYDSQPCFGSFRFGSFVLVSCFQAACGFDDPRLVDLKKSLAAMWQKGAVDSGESFI